MADVKFVLNLKGLNEIMKSAEMQALLNMAANQIAENANALASPNIKNARGGYEVEPAHEINYVAIASVRAGNFESRLDNSRHNTLLKAMEGVSI